MSDDMIALCRAMREGIDSITLGWVKRVKEDSYLLSSQSLTLAQIVDHIPQMLEELCDIFAKEGESNFQDIRASSKHGYVRSVEGYTLTDLLRELELLRNCVFDFVAETEIKRGVDRRDTIRALRRVNQYFGEDLIFVVEYFQRRDKQERAASHLA